MNPSPVSLTSRDGYTPQQKITLALLTASYACGHLDRNVITILLTPIKAEFGVSDTALGLLTGLIFAIFYSAMGIPLGYLADRTDRRHLLGISLTLFSVLTALSGLVSSFAQLVAARIGIGVGEGGAGPAAQSILAEMFRPDQRFLALGIYSSGAGLGALLGLAIGGLVSRSYDWRLAFIIAGLVSLVIAILNWVLVSEPRHRRPGSDLTEDMPVLAEHVPGMLEAARYLWTQQPAYRHLLAAAAIAAIPGFSLLVWTPSLLARRFAMPQDQIGLWLGLLFGCGGAIGILIASYVASRLGKRSIGLSLVPPIVGCCLVGGFSIVMAFAATSTQALWLLVIPAVGYCAHIGPLSGVVLSIVHTRVRARAVAFLLLAANVAGFGLGSVLAGFLSDYMASRFGAASINYSLLIINFGWFWAAGHFWIALRLIRAKTGDGRGSADALHAQ
jgi:predicted MFS family arabinose efflux permease